MIKKKMKNTIVFISYENKFIQGEVSQSDEGTNSHFCYFPLDERRGILYSGEIKNGYTHGKGNLLYGYSDGDGDFEVDNEFTGNFKNGIRDGYGISIIPMIGMIIMDY